MRETRYNPENQKRRWLAYFDILGTRERIASGKQLQIFGVFAQALEQLKLRKDDAPRINYACFSDTFIIYSQTDGGEDLPAIDLVARWFAYNLIVAHIPVRGALACGDFYADKENSLYFGSALVEAHDYGEAPNWLGFLLAPSAVQQFEQLGVPAGNRLNYAYAKLPFKKDRGVGLVAELPACLLGQWITLNGRNPCLDALGEMKMKAAGSQAEKYANTIAFIEANRRTAVRKVGV